ncbi:hypothetical protein [Arenibaculum pallidiluteum]|uniref:hypothetical protein n=1 Tax=Arenibaculum pallidiluteum TaxID=2812559 RepID=UPI001A95B6CA|nr:hypothetical protein [Arenibaculum pallidiluteum]
MSFATEWERCGPWLAAALEHAGGTHALDDVCARVLAGRAQFWPAPDAALVTEIVAYDRLRACRVWLGGGALERLRDMVRSVEAWATAQGCARVEILGRPGWERAIPEVRKIAVLLVKEL